MTRAALPALVLLAVFVGGCQYETTMEGTCRDGRGYTSHVRTFGTQANHLARVRANAAMVVSECAVTAQ